MRAHSSNALTLAQWLLQQDCIERVHYPGLESHPQHHIAKRQQTDFGGVLSFEVKGGKEQAWKVIDATRLISITANLGDTKTTITHPATTTHGRLTAQARQEAGIKDNLIRIAVGLESVEDLKVDLTRGFESL
jgi:O-succinylhomoserine sulfhydrylase